MIQIIKKLMVKKTVTVMDVKNGHCILKCTQMPELNIMNMQKKTKNGKVKIYINLSNDIILLKLMNCFIRR
jgi:hypothetical protein